MKLTIEEPLAKKLYDESPQWFKEQLEEKFGKELFRKKHFSDIKTLEDACKELKIHIINVFLPTDTPDEVAYKKLKVVVKAINQGWKPNWNDDNEKKWYPWFRLSSGFGFGGSGCIYTCAHTGVGSRLCFQDKERSDYAAKQFIDLYKSFLT